MTSFHSVFFPALLDLPLDPLIGIHPTAQRVYLRLLPQLDFMEPRAVKAWALGEELCLRPQTVAKALALLIKRGFVRDCGRGPNNVRLLTLAWSRESTLASERTTKSA